MRFLEIEWKNQTYKLWVQKDQQTLWIHFQGQTWIWDFSSSSLQKKQQKKNKKLKELILSPMPGRIDQVSVKKGNLVKKNQTLLVMSAMKIEYNFRAEGDGVVQEVYCKEGQTVESQQELIKVDYNQKLSDKEN